MVMIEGADQIHPSAPSNETWILNRNAMIQMALIGPAQQWYSHLTLEIKKNWQAFCREIQKTFDKQQSQTQAKINLESIPRASREQIKKLALRIDQVVRKAYVNNAPDKKKAQMKDALVRAQDPQLATIALKKIANHKSTALEPRIPLAQLGQKIHQEDITSTHLDRHKISKISTLTSCINFLPMNRDIITNNGVRTMEEDIAFRINVVRKKIPKYSKGKPLLLKFCKKCSQSGHSN